MADGAIGERWNHTASLAATIINHAFGKKGPPVKPQSIHPHFRRARRIVRLSRAESRQRLQKLAGLKPKGEFADG